MEDVQQVMAPDGVWTVTPMSGALGAEVRGADLRTLDDEGFEALRQVWLRYLVLIFPAQHLSPSEHVAFASRFGQLEIHPILPKHPDHDEIVVIAQDQPTESWHTDVTFSRTPPMASVLNIVALPEIGGDTVWTNQHLAYERLDPGLRTLLRPLTALHSARGFGRDDLSAEHPVVRVHPETGRPSLFVNRGFTRAIPKLSKLESDGLLDLLFKFSEQNCYQLRHRWHVGDAAVWDNRCTMHAGIKDYEAGSRRLERVTIVGDAPAGPALQSQS